MYIQIATNKINTREIPSKGERKAFTAQNQPALLWREGEEYPDKFQISVPRDGAPLPIGKFFILDSSFVINQYGNLELSRYETEFTMFEDATGKKTTPSKTA